MISNDRHLIGLLGTPVKHSKSPIMHNSLFEKYGLKYEYIAFNVAEGDLASAVEGLRALNFAGANVTVPHKVAIIPYLDAISPKAAKIGAVNTIVNKDGRLIGYNTDGDGYLTSLLEETNYKLADKRVLLLGAGGAARAIACAISEQKIASLTILNRDIKKAERLQSKIACNISAEIAIIDKIQEYIGAVDLIINTTTVGMSPGIDKSLVPQQLIRSDQMVSDIIYNPLVTRLLQDANEQGATTHSGLGMFVYQAALAFQKWTGIYPDTDFMRETVLAALVDSEGD